MEKPPPANRGRPIYARGGLGCSANYYSISSPGSVIVNRSNPNINAYNLTNITIGHSVNRISSQNVVTTLIVPSVMSIGINRIRANHTFFSLNAGCQLLLFIKSSYRRKTISTFDDRDTSNSLPIKS